MKKIKLFMLFKGILGMFAFTIISTGYLGSAQANTSSDYAVADTTVTVEAGETVNMNAVMSALEGRELINGDSFAIDEDYEAQVVVSINSPLSSGYSLMSVTNSYSATCYVNILHSGTYTHVATITHSVSITVFDGGLVHISSGSVSVSTLVSYVSGDAYAYNITNTNGSYSYATGAVQLYDSSASLYYFYGVAVTVYQGSSPSFTFQQI